MLLFVESMLWSIIGESGVVVSSVVPSTQALLSGHILTGKTGTRPLTTFHDLVCQTAWTYAMSLTHHAYPLEVLLLGRAGEVLGSYPPLDRAR